MRRHIALLGPHPEVPEFLTVDEAWQAMAALRGAASWEGQPWREALGLPPDLLLRHASAGQVRGAELVTALAGDPAVLLLDEPLAHLDSQAQEVVAGWLGGWRDHRLVVVASHEALPVEADLVVAVRRGQAVSASSSSDPRRGRLSLGGADQGQP